MWQVPLPTRRRASKIGRLPSPRFRAGAAPVSSEASTGFASPKSSTPSVLSALFWRKQSKKSPTAWLRAVGAAPFGWGAIRTGDALPTNGDNDAGTGRRLAKANRSRLSDAQDRGAGPSNARTRPSKIGRLPSPHSPTEKATWSDHQRQRTALETETGRSALAAGRGLHAPFQTFAKKVQT